jgi:hypothetical protein
MKDVAATATALGRHLKLVSVGGGNDVETAFATMAEQKVGAVVVASSPIFFPQRDKFTAVAKRTRSRRSISCATLSMPVG